MRAAVISGLNVAPFHTMIASMRRPNDMMNIIVALSTRSLLGLNICMVVCIGFKPVNSSLVDLLTTPPPLHTCYSAMRILLCRPEANQRIRVGSEPLPWGYVTLATSESAVGCIEQSADMQIEGFGVSA